jgi:hypothetical protein
MGELGPSPSRGRRWRRTAAVGVAAGALVLGIAGPAAAAEASSFGLSVNVTVLGAPTVTLAPTPVSAVGNSPHSVATVTAAPLLTTGVVNTTATADAGTGGYDSFASVDDLAANIAGLVVGADVISATCTATQAGVTGSSVLTGLAASLAGLSIIIPVNPAPNTAVAINVGLIQIATLRLNQQIQNPDGGLTVNALHLQLIGGVLGSIASGDVIVSSATCGPAALPLPLAHGAGLVIGLGLVGVSTAGIVVVRRRRGVRAVAA